jgi:hypothetical protein
VDPSASVFQGSVLISVRSRALKGIKFKPVAMHVRLRFSVTNRNPFAVRSERRAVQAGATSIVGLRVLVHVSTF